METEFSQVGAMEFRAVVKGEERRIKRTYHVCENCVVVVERYYDTGEVVAVLSDKLAFEVLGIGRGDDIDSVKDRIKRFALEEPEVQLGEEFEHAVEIFRKIESGTTLTSSISVGS
jgi:hypothetical protein